MRALKTTLIALATAVAVLTFSLPSQAAPMSSYTHDTSRYEFQDD